MLIDIFTNGLPVKIVRHRDDADRTLRRGEGFRAPPGEDAGRVRGWPQLFGG